MALRAHSIRRETIAKLAAAPLSARRKRTRAKLLQAGSILFVKKEFWEHQLATSAMKQDSHVVPSTQISPIWILHPKPCRRSMGSNS